MSSSSTERRAAAAALAVAMLLGMAATASAEGAADVGKLWSKNCQSCHGADGKGKTKAGEKAKVRDLTAADVKAKLDHGKAVAAIRDGVKNEEGKEVMKPYAEKLSAEEIEALAKHSLSFQ